MAHAHTRERADRWAHLVSEWQRSGLTQAAFCREQGLNANTFNFWKLRVLRQRPGATRWRQAAGASVAAASDATASGSQQFMPVRVIASRAEAVAPLQPCVFEVCLRSGETIRIAADFDEASLRRLIEVLSSVGGADRAC